MHKNAELIQQFYTAFQKYDGDAMAACYHPDITFGDPVYPDLRGWKAGAMWKFLCARAKAGSGLEVQFDGVEADDRAGRAHWIAHYKFNGRPVVNDIRAEFEFKDGRIVKHRDRFDLWKWTGMALGPVGKLLGWTPVIQGGVRKKAGRFFEEWIEKNGIAPKS